MNLSELPQKYQQKALKLGIEPSDISEQLVRGGGKGGQKINKTNSCVVLKHGPTGMIVRCQKHREQSANRITAYKLLINKVQEHIKWAESEKAKKIHKLRKQKQRRSKKAKEKMLKEKAHRSELKKSRKSVDTDVI
jgi:protein subunit release factor B